MRDMLVTQLVRIAFSDATLLPMGPAVLSAKSSSELKRARVRAHAVASIQTRRSWV